MSEAGRWSDLGPRVVSAAVLIVVGGAALWAGGRAFELLVVLLAGLAAWELARMAGGPGLGPVALGTAAAIALFVATRLASPAAAAVLALAVVGGALVARARPLLWLAYAPVILLGAYALVEVRAAGLALVAWLVVVVVASDIAGYLVGRTLRGPKFWPALSPKKTWSGTVGGWVAAAAVGAGFWAAGGTVWAALLAPVVALAAQMGDIAESAVKRRAGVKDASALIPGHGGVMDRFDALLAAALALLVIRAAGGMPAG
jgi:phosphatidate cytidylyltransferase